LLPAAALFTIFIFCAAHATPLSRPPDAFSDLFSLLRIRLPTAAFRLRTPSAGEQASSEYTPLAGFFFPICAVAFIFDVPSPPSIHHVVLRHAAMIFDIFFAMYATKTGCAFATRHSRHTPSHSAFRATARAFRASVTARYFQATCHFAAEQALRRRPPFAFDAACPSTPPFIAAEMPLNS